MKRMKQLLACLLAGAVTLSLAGCKGAAKVSAPYDLPDWALQIAEPELTDMETVNSAAKVDIYYDNTQSMYGFAAGGTMVRAVAALRDIGNMYSNTTTYTLNGVDGVLRWMPFEGSLHSAMADFEGFYTVGKGSFAAGTGPLQMLYYEDSTLDPAAINVVITDLAEQNVDTTDLASKINEHILSQDGYSAALIGILGDFSGKKYVSDLDAINQMNGVEVQGKVPIYILITGRDAALETYVNKLTETFRGYELTENVDFFVARYHAGNSARVLQQEDILCVGPAAEQDGMKKKDWETAQINENLGLSEIDSTHMDTLVNTDHYLNMFGYAFDNDANGINTGRTTLNYFVPISRTDGIDLPVQYKIYTEDEKASTSQLQALYDDKERIRYSELVTGDPREDGTAEEWMARSGDITGAYAVLDKEGEPAALVGWKNIRQITYDKDMTITAEWIERGTPVYDMVMEADGRDAGDYYAGEDMGLAADSDLLHLTIEFSRKPEERGSSTVLVRIPIYAMAESVENLPEWIVQWDSAGTQDYIYHTFGLENFFRTLFGLNVTGDADYNRALREVKVADILTCVTGLKD